MKAEIIAVGTEILLGQVVNTNATFLSEELADLGIEVYYHSVVGDNPERLESLLKTADQRSDLVVLCGGLGPTTDDLTKDVVAAHVGQRLVEDAAGRKELETFFTRAKREMTANNLRQVLVFEDGNALPNETGLAIGIFYQSPTTAFLLLPGPPSELRPMFLHHGKALLQEKFPQQEQLISRVLRFYGIGESKLVTQLAQLIENQTNPTIAPYAKPNEVTLRLTVKTQDEKSGQKLLDETEAAIKEEVGEYFYGYGEENSLEAVVVKLLQDKGCTVTAAESLTAGLFQATLANVSGASQIFSGGFVTYAKEQKEKLLQINPNLLAEHGVVSEACAKAMAQNAREIIGADYALSFTGVAGPNELEGQPAGTVWIGLASEKEVVAYLYHFTRDRSYVRHSAVMAGLDLLRHAVLKK
ncbi:competence/damage-inducible protein A [Enterococcus dispar]|uniref:Putative competence-damage inducible protein n=1 Tax=Enterococcus dispar ATCC 51266 TaxID=1139219 RepID=S1P0C8_9ENTE|nr:competence/damage-inducible protein A [Enterococcus dispar]EOT40148.1 competence/damage-inducible protein CinA [Enterococcus dispar ATCC 51266]EOW86569.1 competence/damage-inducible protein CinA [Enterococcus dispar ATCC 51266]OJG39466.1 competence/damage-inducible protein CinA [Enterococcus dispar]